MYGLITSGRPGTPVTWFSSPATTTRGEARLPESTMTPKFATGFVTVTRKTRSGPPSGPWGTSG